MLEAGLRDDHGQVSYMRSGVMASHIPTPGDLKYCPVCVKEDVQRFKETYWHHTHQVSGVEVCPTHGVFIEESSVSRNADRYNLKFITADEAAPALVPRLISSLDRNHQALAWNYRSPALTRG